MTVTDLTLKGTKHLRVTGKSKRPVATLAEANQTLWLYLFSHPADRSRAGVAVVNVVKGETERATTVDAAQVKAQKWVDDNPDGDPGDSPKDLQGNRI